MNSPDQRGEPASAQRPSVPSGQSPSLKIDENIDEMGEEDEDEDEDGEGGPSASGKKKSSGRRRIVIEYIRNKSRRHITFSKRKAGIMKKAFELSVLTGIQMLLLIASETGHVYTYATTKLQPMITTEEAKNMIQQCLNAGDDQPVPLQPKKEDKDVAAAAKTGLKGTGAVAAQQQQVSSMQAAVQQAQVQALQAQHQQQLQMQTHQSQLQPGQGQAQNPQQPLMYPNSLMHSVPPQYLLQQHQDQQMQLQQYLMQQQRQQQQQQRQPPQKGHTVQGLPANSGMVAGMHPRPGMMGAGMSGGYSPVQNTAHATQPQSAPSK